MSGYGNTQYVTVDANLKDFFIPNSFSPNNDGNNDIFKVYGTSVKEVTLRVYNQWGELIFETENATGRMGWNMEWSSAGSWCICIRGESNIL